jgi:hypothetical protein
MYNMFMGVYILIMKLLHVHVRYRTVPVRCTGSCLASEEFLARDRLLQPSAIAMRSSSPARASLGQRTPWPYTTPACVHAMRHARPLADTAPYGCIPRRNTG